ncbi:MAG: hypothetical protein ABIT01_00695, partial [Thermoanaerobaculia bacterium]
MPDDAGLSWEPIEGWRISRPVSRTLRARGRAASTVSGDAFVDRLLDERPFSLGGELAAEPEPGTRAKNAPAVLRLNIEPATENEAFVIVLRHPSGALTFHTQDVPPRRPSGSVRRPLRFSLPLRPDGDATPRRGLARKLVRLFVLRLVAPLADRGLPVLAAHWEEARFTDGKVNPGWLHVTARGLAEGSLESIDTSRLPAPPARSLLLLHGTLSDAGRAFGDLASTRGGKGTALLARLAPLYGGRIYAFNHRTLSQ